MQIYALYGKSGTGKSYQAMTLCRERNIEGIIDDGLFIWKNSMMAGISAKRQPSKIRAIKTALFTEDEHCCEVRDKIREIDPRSILVLGTSLAMVEKIVRRLELPEPAEWISIESITTDAERETARRERKELGKHVIPVPDFQLKRQFSGFFLDSLAKFRGKSGRSATGDKTVVRPSYCYLGKFELSDKVITDIVTYIGQQLPGIGEVLKIQTEKTGDGIILDTTVTVEYGYMILDLAKQFQKEAAKQLENMTAFHVIAVNVEIRSLI